MIEKIKSLFEHTKKKNGKSSRSILLEIGLSEYDLQEWKSGRSHPTIEKLVKIAEYFEVSLDWLCGRKDCEEISLDTLYRVTVPTSLQKHADLHALVDQLDNDQARTFTAILEREVSTAPAKKDSKSN